MRYDLQDGEEKQREGLRARNWMFMCVCVYAQRYRGPQFARFLSHFTFRLRIGQHCFRSCASLPAYLIHKVVKSNDWNTVHFELSPWQRSHSGRNVKVPVLGAPPPGSGCPHKKTCSWLRQLGKKPIDGPTSLDQHYFLPASLFGKAFFWQGSYCSARLPIEKTTDPPFHSTQTPNTTPQPPPSMALAIQLWASNPRILASLFCLTN